MLAYYLCTTYRQNCPCLDVIPEGYTDLSTPSAANPKKKLIKIQAPDGKKFSTIKAAQEYYAKSMQDKDNSGEEVVEKEDEMADYDANTEDSDVEMEEHSDNEPGNNFFALLSNLLAILIYKKKGFLFICAKHLFLIIFNPYFLCVFRFK